MCSDKSLRSTSSFRDDESFRSCKRCKGFRDSGGFFYVSVCVSIDEVEFHSLFGAIAKIVIEGLVGEFFTTDDADSWDIEELACVGCGTEVVGVCSTECEYGGGGFVRFLGFDRNDSIWKMGVEIATEFSSFVSANDGVNKVVSFYEDVVMWVVEFVEGRGEFHCKSACDMNVVYSM